MNTITHLDDHEFLTQFENKTLNPAHFSHAGHLRLAWLYLRDHDVDTAVKTVCNGIKAYAESLGENDKFHYTMTDAFVRIMARRMEALSEKDWSAFIHHNQDLVNNAQSVLLSFYSREQLFSDKAKVSRVQPDIQAF